MEIYIVPTITNDKILPDTDLPVEYVSDQMTITGSAGEFVPASFVVKATGDMPPVLAVPSIEGIPNTAIDMYTIKCWWQMRGTKYLNPELLLKDDSLIKVEGGKNYLKRPDGTYQDISYPGPIPSDEMYKRWSIDEIPVQDSDTLQPVVIPNGTNKQFWVILKIPDIEPGEYSGTIELRAADNILGTINLSVEVLPINLKESYWQHGIYYTARFGEASISSHRRDATQIKAELQDMIDHGIRLPTTYQGIYESALNIASIEQHLALRNEVGLGNEPLYWIIHGPRENQDPADVPQLLSIAHDHGITDVYFYGEDEALGHYTDEDGNTIPRAETVHKVEREIPAWEQTHALGGKVFVAGVKVGYYSDARSIGEYGIAGDHIDVFIAYEAPDRAEAARWHSNGKKVFSYADPVVGDGEPGEYRRNYGLKIWQGDYDGAFIWAYNYFQGNPWNTLEGGLKQAFGYPTVNGVVDNLYFEGWREGVTDLKYLTTLLEAIKTAKVQGKDTTLAESYLEDLHEADLSTLDLDDVRSDIVNHILILQREEGVLPTSQVSLEVVGILIGTIASVAKE